MYYLYLAFAFLLFAHIFGSELSQKSVILLVSLILTCYLGIYGPSHRGNGEETQQKYEDCNIQLTFVCLHVLWENPPVQGLQ